jgi:hypothetical protein
MYETLVRKPLEWCESRDVLVATITANIKAAEIAHEEFWIEFYVDIFTCPVATRLAPSDYLHLLVSHESAASYHAKAPDADAEQRLLREMMVGKWALLSVPTGSSRNRRASSSM